MPGKNLSSDKSVAELYGTLAPGQFYRRDGARLTGQTDPSLLKVSTENDELHDAYHTFDKAHVVMLYNTDILSREIAAALLAELEAMEDTYHLKLRRESGYGVHAGEAHLINELGEDVGGWIHVGRSTRDIREVGKRIVARNNVLSLLERCVDLCERVVHRADEYADAVVPTYTRVQHAQVSTFGFHLISLERPLERDIRRLWSLYGRTNESPAGAAAGTVTDFPIDRSQTATLLGFETIADNATDVDKSSDIHLEGNFVPVILLHNIATAVDLLFLWNAAEFNLVDIPDELCGTSSIMPQKKNPLGLVTIKNNVNDAIGEATSQLIASRSFGGRGNISLSVFTAAADSMDIFDRILSEISFNRDRGEQLVRKDWALATDIAALIVREAEIPWRSAHQITAILCRRFIQEDKNISSAQPEMIEAIAEEYLGSEITIGDDGLAAVLDPIRAIEARNDVIGSPGESQVEAQISATEEFVAEQREHLSSERDRLERAAERLDDAIGDILSGVEP